MLYKGELITSLVTIGYIVGLMIGMYIEYCLWAQVAILEIYCIYWTVGIGKCRFYTSIVFG